MSVMSDIRSMLVMRVYGFLTVVSEISAFRVISVISVMRVDSVTRVMC